MENTDLTHIPATELFCAAEDIMSDGYDVEFTVTGNSMWPILCHKRDSVVISAYRNDKIKVGDTVLFCPIPGKYLLHRIISVKNGVFRTAGDGNCFCDGEFSNECIIGKVTVYVRNGKKHPASSLLVRLWSVFWVFLFPVRRILLWSLRKISLLKRRCADSDN